MSNDINKCLEIYKEKSSTAPKECYLYKLLETHVKLQQKVHLTTGQEKIILRKNLAFFDKIVIDALSKATCYPNSCKTCPGLKKCLNCSNKDFCNEKVQKLQDELI